MPLRGGRFAACTRAAAAAPASWHLPTCLAIASLFLRLNGRVFPSAAALHIEAYDGYLSPDRWLDEFSTKPKIRPIAIVCTPAQIARSESSQINSGERSIFRAPVRFS
jgi:hypothetical protein